MSILRKLNTLLRAGARESAQHLTDANAMRIYRQEIVDAENLLSRRRTTLAATIATRRDLEREMAAARKRVRNREEQIGALTAQQRSEELLLLAAKDIAATEAHLAALQQRHVALVQRIDSEELTLRKLLGEIKEHRREVTVMASQVTRNAGTLAYNYHETVAGHLATLRDTRTAISGAAVAVDNAEAGMDEAMERIDGDPLERELRAQGQDDESLRVEQVLSRLSNLDSAA